MSDHPAPGLIESLRAAVAIKEGRHRFTLNGLPFFGTPVHCGGDLYCHIDEDGKRHPLLPTSSSTTNPED